MAKKTIRAGLPTFEHEQSFWDEGKRLVGGIDEAGRGPLAGPCIAACVVLDPCNYPSRLNDSKKLNDVTLEALYAEIMASAVGVSIGVATHAQIDEMNIRQATFHAMREAALGLSVPADAFIVDGNALPQGLGRVAKAVISGDALSLSVAAASIIAKVTRDRIMRRYAVQYPDYGFDGHMGYPTKAHVAAISLHGPCPIHRMTFGPLKTAP
ncbi:ribonuclease HII [Rhizobium laguerreae]|uniref:ribonuclease HII n=1 Tax=Rhizobium laguerreae TaxID=1076926 RepID=UPI001C90CF88|nr:ribonuclease HII [Rhizobium laguerreae]MBY3155504.1 ribonuclease HII [Rhizobium laguerreae]